MKTLSVILPTFERGEIFRQTLECIARAVGSVDAEIIVVNDSKKSQIVPDEKFGGTVTVVNNPKSGVASARNFGASKATGKLLLFLDDDILVSRKNISDTLSFFSEHENEKVCLNLNWEYPPELQVKLAGTSFGRYLFRKGFTKLEGAGWLNYTFPEREHFQVISNAASFFLAIPKNLFDSVGGYTESFSYAGFEDYDFAVRLKEHSIVCYFLPSGYVLHNEADRLDMKQWMMRKVRGGVTMRQALESGHATLKLNYPFLKRFTYRMLVLCKPLLFFLEGMIPNTSSFDWLYFRLTTVLLGVSIFEGYEMQGKKS